MSALNNRQNVPLKERLAKWRTVMLGRKKPDPLPKPTAISESNPLSAFSSSQEGRTSRKKASPEWLKKLGLTGRKRPGALPHGPSVRVQVDDQTLLATREQGRQRADNIANPGVDDHLHPLHDLVTPGRPILDVTDGGPPSPVTSAQDIMPREPSAAGRISPSPAALSTSPPPTTTHSPLSGKQAGIAAMGDIIVTGGNFVTQYIDNHHEHSRVVKTHSQHVLGVSFFFF